jgi:hypothetical protein
MNPVAKDCDPNPIGSVASGVTVEWNHSASDLDVDKSLFVFTELSTNHQTQLEISRAVHTCIALKAGRYRVAAFAKGLETFRDTLELQAGTPTKLTPDFTASSAAPKSFQSILDRLAIAGPVATPDLEVPKNTRVVLNADDDRFKGHWKSVVVSDVASAKRIIGNPDHLFPNQVSRFGAASPLQGASRDALIRAAAREYVDGHSGSAKDWEREINAVVFDEAISLSAFLLGTVTINAGGVLEVGTQSDFLFCRLLRMHVASTLLVRGRGPITVEPLAIQTFC